ncbi:MAG: hypothetical protein OJF62_001802 [Pseudolabrys sp.]|jgi:hypothetical protein|nr:hypothetical protein [Pseudolabrys sp.]
MIPIHRPVLFATLAAALAVIAAPSHAQMMERQTAPLQTPSELKTKPQPRPVPVAPIAPSLRTASGRAAFAAHLAASFKTGGYALRVVAEEHGAGDARQFPKLSIAGAFDEPFVYRLISTWRFLEPALKSGFRSVDIVSLLDHRHYFYDLSSGRLPRCDASGQVCG